jgi:uncharacterized integral membrane protein
MEGSSVIYLVLALFWGLLVAIFAVQNALPVEIRFLSWQLSISVALLTIGATIAGAVFLALIALFRQVGMGLKLWDERAKTQRAATDLEQARLAAADMHKEIDGLKEHNRRLLARVEELSAELAEARSAIAAAAAAGPPSPGAPAAPAVKEPSAVPSGPASVSRQGAPAGRPTASTADAASGAGGPDQKPAPR